MLEFTIEVDIDKPRDQVVELMHPDNLSQWVHGFVKMEHISGGLWAKGSKYEWYFKVGEKDHTSTETIITRYLPESFSCTFEDRYALQITENWLDVLPGNQTRWISQQSFLGANWWMSAVIKFMPKIFKSQVERHMTRFKEFAETH